MQKVIVICGPTASGKTALSIELAKKIKYPVILKASAGGGGRGIRVAYSKEELEKAIEQYNSRDRRYGGVKEE